MKDWLQQNPVIDAADVQFLLTEEKLFRVVTKEGNDELAELERTNAENESDAWHGLIPWLQPHHCVLEKDVLTTHKDAHK